MFAFLGLWREWFVEFEISNGGEEVFKFPAFSFFGQWDRVDLIVFAGIKSHLLYRKTFFRQCEILGVQLISEAGIYRFDGVFPLGQYPCCRIEDIDSPQETIFRGIDRHAGNDRFSG